MRAASFSYWYEQVGDVFDEETTSGINQICVIPVVFRRCEFWGNNTVTSDQVQTLSSKCREGKLGKIGHQEEGNGATEEERRGD